MVRRFFKNDVQIGLKEPEEKENNKPMQEKTKRKFLLLLNRKPKKGKSWLNETKSSLRNFATLKGNAQFIFLCNPKYQALYEPVSLFLK